MSLPRMETEKREDIRGPRLGEHMQEVIEGMLVGQIGLVQ
jgi:hypothetical protein